MKNKRKMVIKQTLIFGKHYRHNDIVCFASFHIIIAFVGNDNEVRQINLYLISTSYNLNEWMENLIITTKLQIWN